MLNRSLYQGVKALRPPAHIARALRQRGGKNSLGEPMYRLVWSEGRFINSWGKWHDWPKGTPVMSRNPDDPNLRAVRSVVECRPVPMYPGETSWVLERWFHPEVRLGPESLWYEPADRGGTLEWHDGMWCPKAGLYPVDGDYEETGFYVRNSELSESLVVRFVGLIETGLAEMPVSPFQRALLALGKAQSEEDAKYDEYGKWCEDMLAEDNPFDCHSLGAKAELHKLARSIGIESQVS